MFNAFGMLYSFQFVFLLICATAYYRAADLEGRSGIVWAGMSVGMFMLTWRVLGWGYLGNLTGQLALFGAITLWRVVQHQRGRE
jgi:hypothetical protein